MIDLAGDAKALTKALTDLEAGIRRLPKRLTNATRGRGGRLANEALAKLTREPGKPQYPLRWKSTRQRKKFFATKGFGRGIPTGRSGDLLAGWGVEFVPAKDGGALVLDNPDPAMQFVQGESAQPFHLDTGWVQVADVEDDFRRESEADIIELWSEVADELLQSG